MKKNLFYLFVLICSMSLFAACSSDNDEDTAWKQIPETEISGDNAVLKINDEVRASGSMQMKVQNATEATVNLKNVLPGYSEISVPVELKKQADGSYLFAGKSSLSTPPSMMTKSTAPAFVIYDLSLQGNITLDGKASAQLTSKLNSAAQGELTGTWKLQTKVTSDKGAVAAAPLFLVWSALEIGKPNLEQAANLVNLFGSMALVNVLNQVTFGEDGNITAKYWSDVDMNDIMGGADDNGNLNSSHTEWLDSPKGLAFWYAKDGMLYVVPSISAILKKAGTEGNASTSDLTAVMAKLAAYGVNVETLMPTVMQWMTTGIPLKYNVDGNALKVYVDKVMVTPFVEALLPALPKLQVELEKILADPNNGNAGMIKMALAMMGIEKLTDIETIWKENTKDFNLSLNFTK